MNVKKREERKQLMARVGAQEDARRKKREETKKQRLAQTNSRKRAQLAGKCGAKKKDGNLCQHPSGWGTQHKGIGCCRNHGGNAPNQIQNAAVRNAIFMGAEKDINPYDAMMWCIRITAGEIEWLTEQMKTIDKKHWVENTAIGKQMHVFQRERANAIERLAKFSKEAISLGIQERAIRLAEQYGSSIARLLKGIHDDLRLTPAQEKKWPEIVRRQLILIESAQVITNPVKLLEAGR